MKKNIFNCESEQEFIYNKYDLHETDVYGMNALFHCDLEKSIWLIKHGINIYHLDNKKNNVMMFISSGDMDKAQYLIDIGYDFSDFLNNPEKLLVENMRSHLVMSLILQQIINLEKDKINLSIKLHDTKPDLSLRKRL